jgi:hypothetical protein
MQNFLLCRDWPKIKIENIDRSGYIFLMSNNVYIIISAINSTNHPQIVLVLQPNKL